MDRMYWERVDRDEKRRAEWRLLDEALALRTGDKEEMRVRLGHLLIRAGASLAHERVTIQPRACCADQR